MPGLFTLWSDADRWYVAWAVLHCTAADVVINTIAFGLAAWWIRRWDWPAARPWRGVGIIVAATIPFTVWSEWNAVYRLNLWVYASEMPTIFGIGLSPLLQWIVLPPVVVMAFRTMHRYRGGPANA